MCVRMCVCVCMYVCVCACSRNCAEGSVQKETVLVFLQNTPCNNGDNKLLPTILPAIATLHNASPPTQATHFTRETCTTDAN